MVKKTFIAGILGACVLAAAVPAMASVTQTFDFTFTSSGLDATGTITITDGVAQSGSINVTNIPVEADPSTLITASGDLLPGNGAAQNHNGDNLPYDNLVNLLNNPILTGNGIDFVAGQYGPTHYNTLIGLWGGDVNGTPVADEYTLFVGEAQVDGDGNVIPGENEYVYTDNTGTLTLVPDAGGGRTPEPASLALMTIGSIGLIVRRRRA